MVIENLRKGSPGIEPWYRKKILVITVELQLLKIWLHNKARITVIKTSIAKILTRLILQFLNILLHNWAKTTFWKFDCIILQPVIHSTDLWIFHLKLTVLIPWTKRIDDDWWGPFPFCLTRYSVVDSYHDKHHLTTTTIELIFRSGLWNKLNYLLTNEFGKDSRICAIPVTLCFNGGVSSVTSHQIVLLFWNSKYVRIFQYSFDRVCPKRLGADFLNFNISKCILEDNVKRKNYGVSTKKCQQKH